MKTKLVLAAFILASSLSFASEVSDLEYKIEDLDSKSKLQLSLAKSSNRDEAEAAAHQWYFYQKDRVALSRELANTPGVSETQKKEIVRKIEAFEPALEQAYQALLKSIEERTPPEIKNISATEIERSDYLVTYSVSADIKNHGEPRELFLKISAVQYDGREVDSTTVSGKIDQGETETLIGTCLVSAKVAKTIRDWKVSKIDYYKWRK